VCVFFKDFHYTKVFFDSIDIFYFFSVHYDIHIRFSNSGIIYSVLPIFQNIHFWFLAAHKYERELALFLAAFPHISLLFLVQTKVYTMSFRAYTCQGDLLSQESYSRCVPERGIS
jgi:hypothetical protein